MATNSIRAIVLAAGKSSRFKTKKSKLLFNICGRTMILYPLKALDALGIPMTAVLGHQADEIEAEVACVGIKDIAFVLQDEPRGTGHAVACSQSTWGDVDDILILNGDMPLVSTELLQYIIQEHRSKNATVTFLTAMMMDPKNYGRVIETGSGYEIIEAKDCSPEQLEVARINAGVYLINRAWLEEQINQLPVSSVTGEVYFTHVVALASQQGKVVHALPVAYDDVRGINTLQELWEVEQIIRSELIRHWMANGVRFELAQSIHLDVNVTIGAGSFIGTGVHLLGDTTIGEESWVGAFTIVEDSVVGNNTMVHSHTVVQDSTLGDNVHVGPFARLRNHVKLDDYVDVGNFVELKRTTIGTKSKAKHLTYLGDCTVGKHVNIGAGTVTCNYDGLKKYETKIADYSFIGSNNTIIAPMSIGPRAYTAAGSTIHKDVPEDCLAIGRSRQENKDGYAEKLLKKQVQPVDKDDNQLHCDASGKSEAVRFNFKGALKADEQQSACQVDVSLEKDERNITL
ncbi:MAG: Bifunctional protein GlmU [candidate division TM6 bacterium GW2011_GWF2_38_10]|nr:MAG: Bifunctional protein GlmU [candidate division TM6 bacterium GW2011_GWF2_38_10]